MANEEVFLSVYHLNDTAKNLNQYGQKYGVGGAFHVGVEVYGKEYSYGATETDETGIGVDRPRQHEMHIYKESVSLGRTKKTEEEIQKWTQQSAGDWMGPDYSILNKNCIHFANAMTSFLGVQKVPESISKFAEQAAKLAQNVNDIGQKFGINNVFGHIEGFLGTSSKRP